MPGLMSMRRASYDSPGVSRAEVIQAGEVRSAPIESLRALAALAVLLGHVWIFSHAPAAWYDSYAHRLVTGGGFGVFVFFGLTGYLLFWPLVRHWFGPEDEPIDLGRYARNRALRILPLYWSAVVILLIVQNDGGTATLWWRHLLFVQSLWYDSYNTVDGPLWSVAVELQFYVLLPLIAWGLAKVTRGSRLGAAAILAAAGVGSTVLRHRLQGQWAYQLPTTFVYFTGGMIVALLRHAWEERRPAWLDGPLGSSTLWAAASLPLWALVIDRYDRQELLTLATALLVGALVLPLRPGVYARVLAWRPLALLGVASYSLYVWHVPIIDALGIAGFAGLAAAAVPLSIAAAFGSYRLIETPALRLRRRWARSSAAQLVSPT